MSFFITDAWAEAAAQGPADPLMSFLPLIFIFVVFYFLLIRPQAKRPRNTNRWSRRSPRATKW